MPFRTQSGKIDFCENKNEVAGGILDRGCNVDDYLNSIDLWKLIQKFKKEDACQQNGCPIACRKIIRVRTLKN